MTGIKKNKGCQSSFISLSFIQTFPIDKLTGTQIYICISLTKNYFMMAYSKVLTWIFKTQVTYSEILIVCPRLAYGFKKLCYPFNQS